MNSIAPPSWPWSPILYGNVIENVKELDVLKQADKLFILMDDNTEKYCFPQLLPALENLDYKSIIIRPGEAEKQLETCQEIWRELIKGGCTRHSLLINLGGGVIGDMGGFCAAVFKRGFSQIQIPTTLLSQVDASVGNKTGIDFMHIKNIIGAFSPPEAIVIDPKFLQTLPRRQLVSGLAELIKHALIYDGDLWQRCLSFGKDLASPEHLSKLIPEAVRIKCEVVEKDPDEKGLRKILNFGHTAGHGIESVLLEEGNPVLHGEAVAAGMIIEANISCKLGLLNETEYLLVRDFLAGIFPKIELSDVQIEKALNYMQQDKKNKGNTISFTLLQSPGKAVFDRMLTESELIRQAILEYKSL
jgi:3-dehydroquinate synthase